jgi:hypothetical protein
VYYHTFVAVQKVTLGSVVEMAITGLTVDEQMELVRSLGRYLVTQGMVDSEVGLLSLSRASLMLFSGLGLRVIWHS